MVAVAGGLGELRGLAVSGPCRQRAAQYLPTLAEAILKSGGRALRGGRDTPCSLVNQAGAALRSVAIVLPEWRESPPLGLAVPGGHSMPTRPALSVPTLGHPVTLIFLNHAIDFKAKNKIFKHS